MDKKILLSVLIVALIGIIAATYQINIGEDILNPLASVETEDTPVTDALAAPTSGDSANTGSSEQENNAEQVNAEQAAVQQSGEDQTNTQQDGTSQDGTSQDGTSQSTTTSSSGNTLITADNPVNTGDSRTNDGTDNSGSSNVDNSVSENNDNTNNPDDETNQNIDSDNPDDQTNTKISQAYIYIIKESDATIDRDSGYIYIDNDGLEWCVFTAVSTTGDTIHLYVPVGSNTEHWYSEEDYARFGETPDPEEYQSDITDDNST